MPRVYDFDRVSQSGKKSSVTAFFTFVIILAIFLITLYLALHIQQPYIFQVNYVYKPNYYQKFVLPEDYDVATQGRQWSNWDTDEKGIAKICNLFNASMGYFQNNKGNAINKDIAIFEDWIVAYLTALENSPAVDPNFQGFPWGHNWYEFTIVSTTSLAYYIVNKHSKGAIAGQAAKAIQYIIQNPQKSLGYTRDKANSAMMVFPWTLSHMITGTLDKDIPEYQYAIEQYNLAPNPNLKASEDGIHIDHSYLTHSGVYAYGYLDSIRAIYPDTKQVIYDVAQYKLEDYIDKIDCILKHPTIARSGATLYHRRQDVRMGLYTGKTKTPQVMVMPSMRYIRYFGEDFQWCARGSQTTIAYYESDQNVQNMGLYSILCRRLYTKNSPDTPDFPVLGFISRLGVTELPKVEHTAITTQPHYGVFKSATESYVFSDLENYAVSRMYWMSCPELIDGWFDETIILDIKEQKATIYYWVEKSDKHQICIDDKTNTPMEGQHYKIHIDFKTKVISGEYYNSLTPSLKTMTNNMFDAKLQTHTDDPGVSIVLKHDKPYIRTPGENEILNYDVITENYEGVDYHFQYDEKMNQFMCLEYTE